MTELIEANHLGTMIKVHYLNESRAHRIVWLLEELGVAYEIVRYERDKNRRAPPALRKIHPLGKSPVIEDGGRILAESGAIIEYLVDAYGAGRMAPPRGTQAHLDYLYWLHYAEGSAMPILLVKLVLQMLPKRSPFLVRPIVGMVSKRAQAAFTDPQMAMHLDFWEASLQHSAWFAGDEFSAADIQMSYPVEAAAGRFKLGKGHAAVKAYLAKISARPPYARAREAVS
jgi:glutathione S-transferase